MTALVWPNKDPGETLDYDIDWSERLGSDMVVSSNWVIVANDSGNFTVTSNSFTTTRTKVFVSGGTNKFNYILENTVTTTNGDTMVETVMLPVRQR